MLVLALDFYALQAYRRAMAEGKTLEEAQSIAGEVAMDMVTKQAQRTLEKPEVVPSLCSKCESSRERILELEAQLESVTQERNTLRKSCAAKVIDSDDYGGTSSRVTVPNLSMESEGEIPNAVSPAYEGDESTIGNAVDINAESHSPSIRMSSAIAPSSLFGTPGANSLSPSPYMQVLLDSSPVAPPYFPSPPKVELEKAPTSLLDHPNRDSSPSLSPLSCPNPAEEDLDQQCRAPLVTAPMTCIGDEVKARYRAGRAQREARVAALRNQARVAAQRHGPF